MQALLAAFGNKYFLYALMAIGGLSFFQIRSCDKNRHEQAMQTYERQLQGQLSEKERELQKAHHELGLMKSQLMSQKDLADQLAKDKEELDKDFEKFKKEHKLKIKSRDRTIAKLKQQIGGETIVVVGPGCEDIEDCIISYDWHDNFERFRLKDPNIFNKGDEIFESEQVFKIYGEVYEQEDGSLQTRRLVLREVFENEDGEYEPIPDAKADIVSSEFQYHNPPTIDTEWSWTDLFTIRPLAIASVTAFPDSGALKLGLGMEFFNWEGLGINTYTAFDFKDAEKIEHRLGLAYNPKLWDHRLNLAIGASYGTPYAKFFQEHSVNLDLIFYLW